MITEEERRQIAKEAKSAFNESPQKVYRIAGYCYGVEVERARQKALNAELLAALESLKDQVVRDCSISSDPKYLPMLEKVQISIQAINKAKGL